MTSAQTTHTEYKHTHVSRSFTLGSTPCVELAGLEYFRIEQIFDCGQCFRFEPVESARVLTAPLEFEGVAYGKYVRFGQESPDRLIIYNTTPDEYERLWRHYLSLDTDYAAVRADIAAGFAAACGGYDQVIVDAMECGSGIRILNQEPWETVCSFIISQNNNIPRIKGLISALSRECGEPAVLPSDASVPEPAATPQPVSIPESAATPQTVSIPEPARYSFPTPESLLRLGEDGLAKLKVGFRAKYIYDAASRAADGRLDYDRIFAASTDDARELLCKVKGIGPKVANCALLFAFGKTDAFPIDVWIKRVLAEYYPQGLDITRLGPNAGIAQQYLFYYVRDRETKDNRK